MDNYQVTDPQEEGLSWKQKRIIQNTVKKIDKTKEQNRYNMREFLQ